MNRLSWPHCLRCWSRFFYRLIVVVASLQLVGLNPLKAQLDHEREPISYSQRTATDRVAQLKSKVDAGSTSLVWESERGYLKSLLEQLNISPASQVLVFSKTSLQAAKISPTTPRAVYFSDDVYVGWVPNGELIEIAAADELLGGVFYVLKQQPVDRPEITREISRCIQCHASTHTRRVPGPFVRSVFCDEQGQPLLNLGSHITTDNSPLSERWGGWYVTGTHGKQLHMGNNFVKDSKNSPPLDLQVGANKTDLSDLIDTSRYLTPHSDIVALMILEHQSALHNALTAAGHSGRLAQRDALKMNQLLERPEAFESEPIQQRYDSSTEQIVKALLMSGAITFTESIRGTSKFAQEFQSTGPFDGHGRSLRQLDLKTRLFRYPCSYLIYSEQFKALPSPILQRVIGRLKEVLSSQAGIQGYEHLTFQDRLEVLEILQNTGVMKN